MSIVSEPNKPRWHSSKSADGRKAGCRHPNHPFTTLLTPVPPGQISQDASSHRGKRGFSADLTRPSVSISCYSGREVKIRGKRVTQWLLQIMCTKRVSKVLHLFPPHRIYVFYFSVKSITMKLMVPSETTVLWKRRRPFNMVMEGLSPHLLMPRRDIVF